MDELFEYPNDDMEFYNGSFDSDDFDYDDEVDDAYEM